MPKFYLGVGQSKITAGAWLVSVLLGLLVWASPAWAQAPAWQLAMSGNATQPRAGKSSATATDAAGKVYLASCLIGENAFSNIRLVSTGYHDMFVVKCRACR